MDEYLLSDDPIPKDLLKISDSLSQQESFHNVYFDIDTEEIFAISNELLDGYEHYFQINTDEIGNILKNDNILNYKVQFNSEDKPTLVLKPKQDILIPALNKIKLVDDWDSELTIEKYPNKKTWGFHLRQDKREKLKLAGINSKLEFFIIDPINRNYLLNTITFNFQRLCINDRVLIPFSWPREADKNIEIYTRSFFKTVGIKVLYDTEDKVN